MCFAEIKSFDINQIDKFIKKLKVLQYNGKENKFITHISFMKTANIFPINFREFFDIWTAMFIET